MPTRVDVERSMAKARARAGVAFGFAVVAAASSCAAAQPQAASLKPLVERANGAGQPRLAEVISAWELPDVGDRCVVLRIDAKGDAGWDDPPGWVAGEEATAIWRGFVEARKARASEAVARAIEVARTEERDGGGGAEAAIPLLFLALREDPDHPQARAAIGWVRRDGAWLWPEAARRLARGERFSDGAGWLPKRVDAPVRSDRGLKIASDHWEITSTAPVGRAMALAVALEKTRAAWLQVFGGFAIDAAEIVRRAEGKRRPMPRDPFAAMLVRDRAEYADALTPLEPAAARTLGLYWNPTRTSWFFDADEEGRPVGPASSTVLHEATHQLFAESRESNPLAGERCGFWALEAVACFMESLEPTSFGWTLGGPTAGRVPAARERLIEDGFHVPLRELAAMGRVRLQADERLPMIYSEISGLADFFLAGRRGRHRTAFVEYLRRIYAGTAEPDTLSVLCGRSYEELDDDYRRFMATQDERPSR